MRLNDTLWLPCYVIRNLLTKLNIIQFSTKYFRGRYAPALKSSFDTMCVFDDSNECLKRFTLRFNR